MYIDLSSFQNSIPLEPGLRLMSENIIVWLGLGDLLKVMQFKLKT